MLIRKKSQIYTINDIEEANGRTGNDFVFLGDRAVAENQTMPCRSRRGRRFCTFVILVSICIFIAFGLALTVTIRSRVHRQSEPHWSDHQGREHKVELVFTDGITSSWPGNNDESTENPETAPWKKAYADSAGERLNGVEAGKPIEEEKETLNRSPDQRGRRRTNR